MIKILIDNNIATIDFFMNIFKKYCTKHTCSCKYFTIDVIELFVDYADTELINLMINALITDAYNSGDDKNIIIPYVRKLINLGGKISNDKHMLFQMPNELIEEYVELNYLSLDIVIRFLASDIASNLIRDRCIDILALRNDECVDPTLIVGILANLIFYEGDPIYIDHLMNYI